MKIQTYGTDKARLLPPVYPFHARSSHLGPSWAALHDYTAKRTNGVETDAPNAPMPKDGTCTWKTGEVKGNCVYGEPRLYKKHTFKKDEYVYDYEVRYDEGPGDRAWMEEKDRNYVFRLAREGKLDQVEPNLRTEVPLLCEEVMKYRAERAAKTEAERKKKEEEAALIEAERKRKAETAQIEAEKQARSHAQEEAIKKAEAEKKESAKILKSRTWGISETCATISNVMHLVPNTISSYHTREAVSANRDYRKKRENGNEKDNPHSALTFDGKHSWESPEAGLSKIKYTEGPNDRAWMEEKDRNYLRRIARTGIAEEKAQLIHEVQGSCYQEFFANEIKKFEEEQRKHAEDEKVRKAEKLAVKREAERKRKAEADRIEVERQARLRAQEEAERRKKEEEEQLERERFEEERIQKELEEAEKEVEKLKKLEKLESLKKEKEKLKQKLSQSHEEKTSSQSSQNSQSNQMFQNTEEKELDQSYLIPYEKLEFGLKLGQGGFGAVFQGKLQHAPVAIKKLHLNQLSDRALRDFKEEASVMTKLHHPNVLTLYGVSIDNPGNYSMVIEYMPKGSLYNLLHNDNALSWDLRYRISMDICAGLVHLHEKNILHRDLKSMNVLLDENMRAKLSDFGLSKLRNETTSTASMGAGSAVGTVSWMAPELFKRKGKYNKASDIYSLGMVFWEIASRMLPFRDALNSDQIIAWKKGGEHEDIPEDCPHGYSDMIRECWKEQNARPSVEVLIRSLEKIFNPQQGASQSIHQSGPVYQFETKKNVGESGPVYQM